MWGGKKYWLILKKKFQDLKLVHRSKTTRGHWVRVAGAWYWRNNQELLPVTINHHHCTLHAQFDPLFWSCFSCGKQMHCDASFFVTFNSQHLTLHVQIISSRDGRPAPRGRGGSPPRPALWGRGGSPPRPVKMIKTAGKLRGKIKARISTFSNRGDK